jgi:hypothetical protein
MNPGNLVSRIYKVIFQIIDVSIRVHVDSLFTSDGAFFAKTAEWLRSGKGKHVKAILLATGPLVEDYWENFWRFGIVTACLEIVSNCEFENARLICFLMDVFVQRAIAFGKWNIVRRVCGLEFVRTLCWMLDTEEEAVVQSVCCILVSLCDAVRGVQGLRDVDELFNDVGLREALMRWQESEVQRVAEVCQFAVRQIWPEME